MLQKMGVNQVYLRRKGKNLRVTIPRKNDNKLSFKISVITILRFPSSSFEVELLSRLLRG